MVRNAFIVLVATNLFQHMEIHMLYTCCLLSLAIQYFITYLSCLDAVNRAKRQLAIFRKSCLFTVRKAPGL